MLISLLCILSKKHCGLFSVKIQVLYQRWKRRAFIVFPRLKAKLQMAILFPLEIWKAHVEIFVTHLFRSVLSDYHANANKEDTPLLHKGQTKHKISRPTRVSRNVYFSFCLHSNLPATQLLIFKAVFKESRQFNNRL